MVICVILRTFFYLYSFVFFSLNGGIKLFFFWARLKADHRLYINNGHGFDHSKSVQLRYANSVTFGGSSIMRNITENSEIRKEKTKSKLRKHVEETMSSLCEIILFICFFQATYGWPSLKKKNTFNREISSWKGLWRRKCHNNVKRSQFVYYCGIVSGTDMRQFLCR